MDGNLDGQGERQSCGEVADTIPKHIHQHNMSVEFVFLTIHIHIHQLRSTQVVAEGTFHGIVKAKFSLEYRIDRILVFSGGIEINMLKRGRLETWVLIVG